jgi:polyvinyl alcohol dehydrogenase (cytochrome)
MSRPFIAALLRASLLLPAVAWCAAETPPGPGAQLYQQYCTACHDHPKDRIPAREVIAKRSPEEVVQALSSGVMRPQAAGMNLNELAALATFVTGKAPSGEVTPPPEKNLCARRDAPLDLASPQWNGWGRDAENSRFQPQPGLTAADVPRLELKWAFGYRGSSIYGQPSVVGGRVFATSVTGRIYSLDARTGCTYWTFDAQAPARPAMSVAHVAGTPKVYAFVGDDSATVYALDAANGLPIWRRRLDVHPSARISGAPVFHDGTLYVPVSSLEELSGTAPGYECCKFRGSVAAIRAIDGTVLWQTYTIDTPAKPYRKAKDGTQLYGPAGGAVWTAPTVDAQRKLLYVGVGNSYTDVAAPRTDSIIAIAMDTGRIAWAHQLTANDNFIVGCENGAQGNCPQTVGPDIDPAGSPILRNLPDGRQVLLAGAKSGVVHALDPANGGKPLWEVRLGVGGMLGGIEWGAAADATQLYVAISDVLVTDGKGPGGLTALRVDTGKQVWHTPAPKPVCAWGPRSCTGAQSQAVSAIPGIVFSGSHDGHLRAYATANGRVVWDVDTAQPVETVNAVPAVGGSLDHGGATVAGGMVYVNSGYGRINGQPGNVLLAYGLP